ncbi:MAG: cytochrome C biogenesis protein, partial [Opitutales bacterium]
MKRAIYITAALLVLLLIGRNLRSSSSNSEFDIDGFAELPVQVGGRIKPLDTVARNTLLVLASRQKVITPEGHSISPIEWFLDLTMRP